MSKELKAYRLTEKIIKYSNGKVSYDDAIASAKRYYKNKPLFSGLFTHVGDEFIARELSKKLTK